MTWSEVTNPVNDSQDPRCPDSESSVPSVLRVASGMSGISLGDLPDFHVCEFSLLPAAPPLTKILPGASSRNPRAKRLPVAQRLWDAGLSPEGPGRALRGCEAGGFIHAV